jgi:hypothetical protein
MNLDDFSDTKLLEIRRRRRRKRRKTGSEIHVVGAELGLGFENLFDLGILMVEDGIIVADGSTRRSGIDSATSTLRELTSTTAAAATTTTTTTTRTSAAAIHVVAAMCDPPQPTTATKQRTNHNSFKIYCFLMRSSLPIKHQQNALW